MKRRITWLLSAAMFLNPLILHGERLAMRVTPAFSSGDVYIYVSIERRAENRALSVTAESDGFFGRSTVQLEGERSSRVKTFHFGHLPAGTYDIVAELIDSTGKTTDVTHYALMMG